MTEETHDSCAARGQSSHSRPAVVKYRTGMFWTGLGNKV